MKKLNVYILTSSISSKGVSSDYDSMVLYCDDSNDSNDSNFENDVLKDMKEKNIKIALIVQHKNLTYCSEPNYTYCKPLYSENENTGYYAASGKYATSSSGYFSEYVGSYPIAIHDYKLL